LGNSKKFAVLVIALAVFLIDTSGGQAWGSPNGRTRTYYIAADEVMWDYAPQGRNLTGMPGGLEEDPKASKHKTYLKAIYREYTDGTFKTLKPRAPEWQHLGILGPLIRAEVGDVVKVVFQNNTKLFCSMHPHGLAYAKNSEGAMYNDGTALADKADDAVSPGERHTYTWMVPERAGPGPDDPSSIVWMYHSHFVEPRDMNAGLFGPIIVSAKGSTKPDGTPKDVDREFITAFAVFDETGSWYFDANLTNSGKYVPGPAYRALSRSEQLKYTDPALYQSYQLYSINGLIEGNLPMLTMKKGERVRWYLLANSNEDDVHTVHWHGQTVMSHHMRTDMLELGPMMMAVADMVPDSVGTWLLHCHVNEHIKGGMQALFTVTP
jgi:FtsP/CotA-like multicopper oxidase with cupredoxin domain